MGNYIVRNETYGRTFTLEVGGVEVCTLTINGGVCGKWTITAWYTKEGYKHKGYGNWLMREAIKSMYQWYGKPKAIEYVWNGANQYVYDWLEKHFDPVCKCPLAVLKTHEDDEWDAHVYMLDVEKFLHYYDIKENKYAQFDK